MKGKINAGCANAAATDDKKRSTLKTLVAGTGVLAGSQALPDRWMRPVVSSILLPAHAQTSPAQELSFEASCGINNISLVRDTSQSPTLNTFSANLSAEADDGVLVNAVVRADGDNEWDDDVVFTTAFSGGVAAFEALTFGAESEGSPIQVDFDIGQDDVIDCDEEVSVSFPD